MKKELMIGELQRITPDNIENDQYRIAYLKLQEKYDRLKVRYEDLQDAVLKSNLNDSGYEIVGDSGFLYKLIGFIIISVFVSWCIAGYMGLGLNPIESLPKFLDIVISN